MTITILGDICPAWGFPKEKRDADTVFNDLLPVIRESDYCVANLEAPATDREQRLAKNSICLKARPTDIEVLKNAGISAVSLANNHILDYGQTGFEDTLINLQKNNIAYYGAGNEAEAAKPLLVTLDGKKVGFLSFAEREFNCSVDYGKGANLWDDLAGVQQIRNVKSQCDYLIVQYHGGIEHYKYPSPYLQKKCRAMAEAGADFITCQHSHCIGTREQWQDSEILYGQGNCIFGFGKNDTSWNDGLIVQIELGEQAKIKYIPIQAKEGGENLMDSDKSEALLRAFEEDSVKLSDLAFLKKEWECFCDKQKDMYLPLYFAKSRFFNKLNRLSSGMLINCLTKRSDRRNSMNLLRCDAHREVVQTILEREFYGNK